MRTNFKEMKTSIGDLLQNFTAGESKCESMKANDPFETPDTNQDLFNCL